ncbi:ankyrin repeat and fibronectin type-III domain-containing protein 1-like isoform X2 [Halichondria panicea]|uniref:ankyrin repeat and fibronectin type-III domain-containing protein 1-like isoform X2 n=1 Tax=Halichondria panicea TaxID=6063 RepID=UPI00312B489E
MDKRKNSSMEGSSGWGSSPQRYSVDIQPSPPTHRQMYSVDIQRSVAPSRQTPSHDSPSLSNDHSGHGSHGSKMQKFSSYSSLDRPRKHAKHPTSPELHSSHTLPNPHTHTPHRHNTEGDGRGNLRGPQENSSSYPSAPHQQTRSSRLSQPDPYENRRFSQFSDGTLTPSHSSQASYDGQGVSPYSDGHQHKLSPWELSSPHSSQSDSTQSSELFYYKTRPPVRPSSGRSRKPAPVQLPVQRAVTPNPSAMINRGEAWQLEEDWEGRGSSGHPNTQGATVGHMDQALLPQKHYFHTLPSHSSHSSQASHHHSQQHTVAQQQQTVDRVDRVHPLQKRHSVAGLPTSPTHQSPHIPPVYRHDSRSLSHHSSQDFSPRNSSVVSPTHLANGQRRGSFASVDSNHSSGSYHSNTNSTACLRRSSSMQLQVNPSPKGSTSRRVVAVIGQQIISPERVTDHMTSPGRDNTEHEGTDHRRHSTSEAKHRRRHRYEQVRAPHPYEKIKDGLPQTSYPRSPPSHPSQSSRLSQSPHPSQSSQEEPVKPSPTVSRWVPTKRESRPKSSPAPRKTSDSILNRLSRKGTTNSPAPGKRFSAGSVLDGPKALDEDQMVAKLKQRMSSPEIQLHTHTLNRYFPNEEQENSKEQSLSDSDGTPSTKRGSRTKSTGTIVLHKIAKKFGKMSIKSGGGDGGDGSDGSGGAKSSSWSAKKASKKRKKNTRSNSVSNLADADEPSRLTQSMEQLNDICHTPTGTPKMTRSSSKSRLSRRGSEPDLDAAPLSGMFRSGSKKNLSWDPNEELFELIERGNTEELKQLLQSTTTMGLNLQAFNDDDLLPLDVAAMLNQSEIAKLLMEKGAKDSAKFCRDISSRYSRVMSLLGESERELDSLKHEIVTQSVSNSSGLKDIERRLRKWEWKLHQLKKMKQNFNQAGVPEPPATVTLHVTSNRSLTVSFTEPQESNGAVVTRYKIEWCRSESFSPVVGEFVMTDLRSIEYAIPDLDKGEPYFVRVSAYNMKGFGPARLADPPSAIPSSWHDIDSSQPRYEGKTDQMYALSAELNMMLSHSPPISPSAGSATPGTSRSTKASLKKRLFGSNIKFQHKSLKSGVYIASLVYSEDSKILVTLDEHIPILEVSDSDPSKAGPDFVWLAKVGCTWENVRAMCESSDSYTSSPAVQFRNKLLHAVLALQESLGMQDLGLLHPVPYKDKHGATVFVLVQCLKEAKLRSSSFKWMSLPRLRKRKAQAQELDALPVPDQLVLEAHEITDYHMNSTRKLDKGLYLGYLKGRSTVASIKVICSREYPNVLPYMKIRDNPNISSDEWQWFKSLSSDNPQPLKVPAGPQSLQETLLHTIETFLHNLKIAKEDMPHHQLYKYEAIELNEDITFLLLLPPAEQVCTPPGSSDHFASLSDFVALPINTFEIMQLFTYQPNFMTKYSTVSARLDLELLTSTQRMREAFSNDEFRGAKRKNEELEKYQERAEPAWKQMRWIEEAVQNGRDISNSGDNLLSVATIKKGIDKARTRHAQQQQDAERRREKEVSHQHRQATLSSGYLRVFPAYTTGLVKGTSVKLFISQVTSTTEVVRLVVHQLEKARLDRGVPGSRLTEEDLSDFYLVGMTNTNEWILDTRAHPLSLQASVCRLEVRRRSEQFRLDEHITSV